MEKDKRLCIYCENWHIENSERGWSRRTPGSDYYEECHKEHWFLDTENDTRQAYRNHLIMAKTCSDFVLDPKIEE